MSYVLVVEDDPFGADHARDILKSIGHSVRIVSSFAAAARLMVWSRPCVVLADHCLPSHDDLALQATCDSMAVPLFDVASAICLMGRAERRSEQSEHRNLSTVW